MNSNLARIIGAAASTKLDPHASKLFSQQSGPIERPRMTAGTDAMQAAYTKTQPANGVYFVNIERDTLEQWVVDHWEVVAQHNAESQMALDGNQPLDPRATPTPFSLGSGGGGGVSPAPRQPGGPSITDPMGTYHTAIQQLNPNGPAFPIALADGVPTVIVTYDPLSGGQSLPRASDQNLLIAQGMVVPYLVGDTIDIFLFINGVDSGFQPVSFTDFTPQDYPGGSWESSGGFTPLHAGDILSLVMTYTGGSSTFSPTGSSAWFGYLIGQG